VNCNGARGLLHPYVDGELDLVRHLEVEHHIQECSACAEETERQRALRQAIVAGAPYHRASAGLRDRLSSAARRNSSRMRYRPWLLGLAAAATITLAAWGIGRIDFRTNDRLAEEVVASHVRSRMAEHLFDVASSDQHQVKPWLSRRLDFAPAVFDFSKAGFSLMGGRLDYLDGAPAAALVYQRREHVINLFIAPTRGAATEPRALSRRGFNLVHWSQGDMNHWAVSDLNERELLEFAQLVQKQEEEAAGRR
jgi:anti-sigma factor RsiW